MKQYFVIFAAALTLNAHASPSNWKHVLKGPIPLDDTHIQEIYKNESDPARHNGVTVTKYLDKFDLKVIKKNDGCFQAYIGDWLVESTIFVRPKSSEYKGQARFSDIGEFNCRGLDSYFNTYEGTLHHEQSHFELRDRLLKMFWTEFYTEIAQHCAKTKQSAEMWALKKITTFLEEIHKADREELAELEEHKYYVSMFEATTEKKCQKGK
ncbi:hypothetical protein GW915_08650 [bacterium]|nr:hypothetical protein [bacterium]